MNGGLSVPFGGALTRHECSRAACRADAVWAILWRNPRIHGEERRKTWLACSEHVDYLREFLAARSFPLRVVGIDALPPEAELGGVVLRAGSETAPVERIRAEGDDPAPDGGPNATAALDDGAPA